MSRTKKEEEDEVYKEPQEIIIHPMKSMTSPQNNKNQHAHVKAI